MDNKKNAIDALTSLANSNVNKRSDAAKLREVFEYVELALSSGVRREKVLETIRDTLGVNMSLKAFDKNLYMIRKKQRNASLKETPKKNQEINSGSQQLIATSTIVSKPTVTDTVSSKKFISPGDIKNQRNKGMEEAINLENELYNSNYEEINQ